MSLIAYLIIAAFTGLIVGAIARLLLPGRDPMSILETILVGMAGSLVASLFAYYVLHDRNGAGFILSVLFATLFVWVIRRSRQRGGYRRTPHRGFGL
jgi:uncharacterized membrane protein YeaQ/YmgE (transglycosylase-associated protein family)